MSRGFKNFFIPLKNVGVHLLIKHLFILVVFRTGPRQYTLVRSDIFDYFYFTARFTQISISNQAGIFLGCYYAAVMGFRGKALGYAIFVIVFTCLCIWLFVNFDELFDWLRDTIGVWWTIAITLVMCAVFWVAMKLM